MRLASGSSLCVFISVYKKNIAATIFKLYEMCVQRNWIKT